MTTEIPQYALRAYALFYSEHGSRGAFKQSELDWIVGQSMKKKIFSVLLRSGWLVKESRTTYRCVPPKKVMQAILEFKVPQVMSEAERPYAFTGLSAIEVWSDYSYVQRGIKKSPYYIKILDKDREYWKEFFNRKNIPWYVKKGSTIGEYIILCPVNRISCETKHGISVEPLEKTLKMAEANELYSYAAEYIRRTYGAAQD